MTPRQIDFGSNSTFRFNVNPINMNNQNLEFDDLSSNLDYNLRLEYIQKRKAMIAKVPKYLYGNYKFPNGLQNTDLCTICLEKYKTNEMICEFPCKNHIFHEKCLKIWLESSNYCPLCKYDLVEEK